MEKLEARLPLQIIFIWNPQDENEARPLADYCFDLLSKDVQKPFSRSMNMPVYLYRIPVKGITKENRTKHTLIFPFVSLNAASDENWVKYFKQEFKHLPKGMAVVPVALDGDGISLSAAFGDVNFIRAYDVGDENRKDWLFITIAHEIYRRVFVTKKNITLNIFLSHRKEKRGQDIADALKAFVDRHTHMRDFFDVTDILPGEDFSRKIKESIPGSALLAIHTDNYSESYWCQKEVLLAKKHGVPMLRLDALEKGEDRSFPALGNVPVLRIGERPESKEILHILAGLMLETVRMNYAKALFEMHSQWYGLAGVDFTARVPEPADMLNKHDRQVLYYGEPVIYPHEKKLLRAAGIQARTLPDIYVPRIKKRIGISISNPSAEELKRRGLTEKHLEILSQELARQLLSRKAVLLYGGDLRENGFTEYLFEEARILQDRLQSKKHFVENYLAWPIYRKDEEKARRWKSKYRNVARMRHVSLPKDIEELAGKGNCIPKGVEERYLQSRCFTKMRNKLVKDSDIRICVGGKCSGYSGLMPGVLEEFLLAVRKEKPVFVLGGFGGAARCICDVIEDGMAPELTYDWQAEHNLGYGDLRKFYETRERADFEVYDSLTGELIMRNLRNGLSDEENRRLFRTKYVDEAVYLILKGIGNLNV